MTSNSAVSSSSPARRARRVAPRVSSAMLCSLSLVAACSDDDTQLLVTGGGGGAAGAAGATAGAAGSGGASDAGVAGAAGTGGALGLAGADAGSSGPHGTVTVLNDDADDLRFPTTAALRETELWVVNGQLDAFLSGSLPALPFNVVSVPLAGGAIGATQIALPGSGFFPEGIAAAPDGTLFVGSMPLGTIVRIPAGSTTADADEFVEAGVARRGVTGITVGDDILWFCDSTLPPGPGGGDIVGVDLQTGVEVVRHAMPDPVPAGSADAGLDAGVVGVGGSGGVGGGGGVDAGVADAGVADAGVVGGLDAGGGAGAPAGPTTFCNDLIVAPDGDLFATDSTGRVFRVDAADVEVENSASVWLEHPAITTPGGFGANGIEPVGDKLLIAANGTLVAVDPESDAPATTLQVLTLSEGGAAVTLCGPDGLQAVPDRSDQLVVVENGFCDSARERVVRVTLSGLD